MRDVKFIDHEPPPATKAHKPKGAISWAPFVIGILSSQPGRWAIVESETAGEDARLLRLWSERNGVPVEAGARERKLYARVTA